MSQIYNKMRIDVKEEITDIITAKQDDSNSRFLDVYLYDGATPIDLTGEEVRIYMRKPDGTEIFNNGEITDAANGRCQFELTSQALGAVGVLKCEISIWQGNTEILTTQTFYVFVTESLRSNGSVESSNEYGALVLLYQNLYQSIDLMQDMVANFGTPSGTVDADTFWQMLEKLYEVNEAALANASVSEVLNRIGRSTDGAGSGTLFGAINPLDGLIEDVKTEVLKVANIEKAYTPSDTLVKTVLNSEKSTDSTSTSSFFYLGKWIPEHSGAVKVTFRIKSSSSSVSMSGRVGSLSLISGNYQSTAVNDSIKLDAASVGALVNSIGNTWNIQLDGVSSTSYANTSVIFKVEKGVPVYFGLRSGSSDATAYCNKITINASEV